MKRRKLIWVDAETTGTLPTEHDIWELATIIEIDGVVEEEKVYRIRPYRFETIDEGALKVGGISLEELEKIDYTITDCVSDLKDLWGKYVDKYNKADKFIISGYNVSFDRDFLYNMFRNSGDRYGLGSWAFWPSLSVDTFVAEYMNLTGMRCGNYKLNTVCESFGIKFDAHNALEDIKATRQLYYTLKEAMKLIWLK